MANTNWENLPSTNTPINATNLNKISDGLVNVSNEVDSTYKTNMLETINLFDNKQIPVKKLFGSGTLNYTPTSTGVSISYTTNESASIVYKIIDVSNYVGEKITIKANYDDNSKGHYNIGLCDANGENRIVGASSTSSGEVLTYTIPSLATSKYLALWFYCEKNGTVNYTNIMVNFGNTSLDYEPFIQNQILVNNEKYTDTINVDSAVDSRSRVNVLKSTNLFDGKIELGSIDAANGNNIASSVRTRSSNFTSVKPNTTYYYYRNSPGYRWIIGYNQNQVGITDGNYQNLPASITNIAPGSTGGSFTTTNTTYYIRWYDTSSTELTDKVMINKGSTALPYEPYIVPSINVDGDTIYKRTSAINGTLSSDYSVSASNTYEKIPFNTTSIIGSNLSLNNNVIVIGEGIDYIDISSSIYIQAIGGTGIKYIKILKNSSTIDLKYVTVSANAYYIFTSTNIIPVSENDTIEIQAYGLQNDRIVKNSSIVVKTI